MSKLIFFVDDDKMILNLLEYTLNNRHDYNIKTFITGEECIKNLYLKPDLIVLDHYFKTNGVENMNGLEILGKIRKKDKNLPVIILTNAEDEEIESEYKKIGASNYISKNDYFIDNLMQTITEIID